MIQLSKPIVVKLNSLTVGLILLSNIACNSISSPLKKEITQTPTITPTQSPTQSPTITLTPTPKHTETPTPTATPDTQNASTPREAIELIGKFTERGDIISASGNYAFHYSNTVLDTTGVESIRITQPSDMDNAFDWILNQIYRYAGRPRGARIDLMGGVTVNGVKTESVVTGIVDEIVGYIVIDDEFNRINDWLKSKDIKYRSFGGRGEASVICFFDTDGKLIIISQAIGINQIKPTLKLEKIKQYGIGDIFYGMASINNYFWKKQRNLKAGDSTQITQAWVEMGCTLSKEEFTAPNGQKYRTIDCLTLRVWVTMKK